jgi:ankyrin repeat protein
MKFTNHIHLKALFFSVMSFCAFGSQRKFVIHPALKATTLSASQAVKKTAVAAPAGTITEAHPQPANGQPKVVNAAKQSTLVSAVAKGILTDVIQLIAAGEQVTQDILNQARALCSTGNQTEIKVRKELFLHLLKNVPKKVVQNDYNSGSATTTTAAAGPAQQTEPKDQKKAMEESAPTKKAVGAQASASVFQQGDETESEDDIDSSGSEQFIGQYYREDLKQNIEAGTFNLDERIDEDGEHTIIMEAAIHNDVEIAELAIKKGFRDFHAQNNDGDNALTLAALHGSIGMMELLAKHMALDTRDKDDNTALNAAVAGDQLEMVCYMLGTSLKQHINSENNSGMTPLINSVFTNNPRITRLLLTHGADASHKPSKCPDKTALACAQCILTPEYIKDRMEFGNTTERHVRSNNTEIIQMITNANETAYTQLLSELNQEDAKKKKKTAKKLKRKNKSAKISAELYRTFLTTPKYLAANKKVYGSIAKKLKSNPQLAALDHELYDRALKVTEQLDKDMAELSRLLKQKANE